MSLPLWSWECLSSELGKAGAGVEVIYRQLWESPGGNHFPQSQRHQTPVNLP